MPAYGNAQVHPDAAIVAVFKQMAFKNDAKSAQEGRDIYDDWEVCELRYPGSSNVGVYPANAVSHWQADPITGAQRQITYAERFRHQYDQFKSHAQQTKEGTPLTLVPVRTEARRAELRALNVYTVEALAAMDGAELKNLGHNGRDLKNQAADYIRNSAVNSTNTRMLAELEALRARNAILEEDLANKPQPLEADKADGEFDGMSLDQLRDYITTNTGIAPRGSNNRKTLVRMAQEAQPKAA
jgi:hypothetical protein